MPHSLNRGLLLSEENCLYVYLACMLEMFVCVVSQLRKWSKFFCIVEKPQKTEKIRPVTHDRRSVTSILQPMIRDP